MTSTIGVTSEDHTLAVSILQRRLEPTAIRRVLNALQATGRNRKSVEWMVVEAERSETAGGRLHTKLPEIDLAPLLVDLTGPDLLQCHELRLELARQCSPDELDTLHEYPGARLGRGGTESQARAIAGRRWSPGRSWASHFARTLGFPIVFAGLAGDPGEAASMLVEPFVPLPPLQDFQQELLARMVDVLDAEPGRNRAILTLPTGAGKTRTAVESLVCWRLASTGRRAILWIAQSEELCEQAVQAFREVWIDQGHRPTAIREPVTVSRLWGGGRAAPAVADVVVASIQKLHAIISENEEGDEDRERLSEMAEQVGVVIVDEAHRMLAPSYSAVFAALRIDLGRTSRVPIIGLTATPYRSDDAETRRLVRRFHGILLRPTNLGDDPIAELRRRGVLSRPVHNVLAVAAPAVSVDDDPRFQEHFQQFNDFHPELLRRLGQDSGRNKQILRILSELPAEWPTLLFACSIDHARAMAVLLRRRGRLAAVVSGETRAATRRFLVEEFREGRVSVLCNYGVLTTGFDAPRVRALVIARPTASVVLYEQMIGRGMRGPIFGGTDECLVIDLADNIRFGGQLAFSRYAEYWND